MKNHAKDKAFLSCLYILPETFSLKALIKNVKEKGFAIFLSVFSLKDQVCTFSVVVYNRTKGIILIAIRKATADMRMEKPSTNFK